MRKSIIALAMLVSCLLLFQTAFAFDEGEIETTPTFKIGQAPTFFDYVPDEVLVKFKIASEAAIAQTIQAMGTKMLDKIPDLEIYELEIVDGSTVEEVVQRYLARPDVEYAEPNYYYYAQKVPNDPYYSTYQWHYPMINLPQAWDITTGSTSVKVAIVDSGIYMTHEDLTGNFLMSGGKLVGYDYVNNDSTPNDDFGHGTHVAGTVAAVTNNAKGVAGTCWNARLMVYKVLNSVGSGSAANIAKGLKAAADAGARIINFSVGGGYSDTVKDAVAYAYDKNSIIFAAAGNNGTSSLLYPASDSKTIAVGAVDARGNVRASYSNYGTGLDLVAPGGDTSRDDNHDGYADGVCSTIPLTGSYLYSFDYQGTSMATPHVAGVAALMLSLDSSLNFTQVRNILRNTATDLGDIYQFGAGLLNAYEAVKEAKPPPSNGGNGGTCSSSWEMFFAYAGMLALGLKSLFKALLA